MINKIWLLATILYAFTFQSKAFEITYNSFHLIDKFYGVSATIYFNSDNQKSLMAKLVAETSTKCGKAISTSNKNNIFFNKNYLAENIDNINLRKKLKLFG